MLAAFFAVLGVVSFAVFARADAGHGDGDPHGSGSPIMARMMDMMHSNLNKTQAVDCNAVTDADLMERGEEFMEQMMGGDKEAHEKMEAAMNKEGHDNMHTMMGAWATGCVSDKVAGALAERAGASGKSAQGDKSVAVFAVLIGIIIGIVLTKFFFTKSAA